MSHPIVELASIRLKPGVTEQDLVIASNRFQQHLSHVQGFLRRDLLRLNETDFADLVYWRSREDADAMMAGAAASPECMAYFSVMDMAGMDPADGVKHYSRLASYERA